MDGRDPEKGHRDGRLKNCIKFAPPFVTSRHEIDQAIDIFSQSLKAVESASRT